MVVCGSGVVVCGGRGEGRKEGEGGKEEKDGCPELVILTNS